MANTVTVTGSKFVARISGQDAKYQFSRTFIGEKIGVLAEAVIESPGLYETGDTFLIIFPAGNGVSSVKIEKAQALRIAKRMDAGDPINWAREALPVKIEEIKYWLRKNSAKLSEAALAPKKAKLAELEQELARHA
jgi:hypothetical protein